MTISSGVFRKYHKSNHIYTDKIHKNIKIKRLKDYNSNADPSPKKLLQEFERILLIYFTDLFPKKFLQQLVLHK